MPSLQLKIKMSLGSSGKILFAGSAFRDQSCQIMGHSLTTGSIGTSAKNRKHKTYTLPPGIPRAMQAEASNKTLLTALKKRLDSAKGKWVEELPGVLWAYRTTTRRPIDVSPFALTYGMEAVIPTKIGLPTIRTSTPEAENGGSVIRELDTSDELRETPTIRVTSY